MTNRVQWSLPSMGQSAECMNCTSSIAASPLLPSPRRASNIICVWKNKNIKTMRWYTSFHFNRIMLTSGINFFFKVNVFPYNVMLFLQNGHWYKAMLIGKLIICHISYCTVSNKIMNKFNLYCCVRNYFLGMFGYRDYNDHCKFNSALFTLCAKIKSTNMLVSLIVCCLFECLFYVCVDFCSNWSCSHLIRILSTYLFNM